MQKIDDANVPTVLRIGGGFGGIKFVVLTRVWNYILNEYVTRFITDKPNTHITCTGIRILALQEAESTSQSYD